MKCLIKLKGWIGADAIQESDVGARDAGERWELSLTPGEIEVYPLGEPERFMVKIEQVSVKPTEPQTSAEWRADGMKANASVGKVRAKGDAEAP